MVGTPLNRFCLKKMEHCVGIIRQISKSNRYWSCNSLNLSFLVYRMTVLVPLIPEVFPRGSSRQSSMAQTHWVREWMGVGKQPVYGCVLPNHQKLKTWIHPLSGYSGFHFLLRSLSKASTKHSRLFIPGDWLIQNQAQFQFHKTISN